MVINLLYLFGPTPHDLIQNIFSRHHGIDIEYKQKHFRFSGDNIEMWLNTHFSAGLKFK